MADAAALRQVHLFTHIPESLLATLSDRLVPRSYRSGQAIFHQGDEGASLHLVRSGKVKIVLVSEQGQELLVAHLGPGEFMGEMSLLDQHPRSATAIAAADTQTYTLNRKDFLAFLQSIPEAAIAVCIALAERLRRSNEHLAEEAFLSLPQRLSKRLLLLAEEYGHETAEGLAVDVPLSQRELGELVGATRQSVNKVLSQWENVGLLRRQGRILVLTRPEKLRAIFAPFL